jgi:hypothetical protein
MNDGTAPASCGGWGLRRLLLLSTDACNRWLAPGPRAIVTELLVGRQWRIDSAKRSATCGRIVFVCGLPWLRRAGSQPEGAVPT